MAFHTIGVVTIRRIPESNIGQITGQGPASRQGGLVPAWYGLCVLALPGIRLARLQSS
jgi:hypothetical protein